MVGPDVLIPESDKWPRTLEAQVCAMIAQEAGDRLFAGNRDNEALACWRIAALIRQRLDGPLAPF